MHYYVTESLLAVNHSSIYSTMFATISTHTHKNHPTEHNSLQQSHKHSTEIWSLNYSFLTNNYNHIAYEYINQKYNYNAIAVWLLVKGRETGSIVLQNKYMFKMHQQWFERDNSN